MTRTILIADDNKVNQMVAKLMLEREGYVVSIADTGKIAIESLINQTIDMILMDVHMPDMDGHEATRTIRASGNQVPILAITGGDTDSELQECINSGMNDFIIKPFEYEEFHQKIKKYLLQQ